MVQHTSLNFPDTLRERTDAARGDGFMNQWVFDAVRLRLLFDGEVEVTPEIYYSDDWQYAVGVAESVGAVDPPIGGRGTRIHGEEAGSDD